MNFSYEEMEKLNIFGQNDPEVSMKNKEYKSYIHEHCANVRLAFENKKEAIREFLLERGYVHVNRLMYEIGKRAVTHDATKMGLSEFPYYRAKFYPTSAEEKEMEHSQDAKAMVDEYFNTAWIHHAHHNDHHPEYWITRDFGKEGWKDIQTPMPLTAAIEMLLDWEAMSIKFGGSTYQYYMDNRFKKPFHRKTIELVEDMIDIFK